MSKVKERRITKPSHVLSLIREQINILRQDETLDNVERARAIAYLSNTALAAYKDGEGVERMDKLEAMLKESGVLK